MANKKLSLTEEVEATLLTLLDEYHITGMSEQVANIFYGKYVLLKVKWAIEFFLIGFLFIFFGILLWNWKPETFECKTALKVVLECGLYCVWSYLWSTSYDKHAVETTRKFVSLANLYPNDFTRKTEEDPNNGTEGNADKRSE